MSLIELKSKEGRRIARTAQLWQSARVLTGLLLGLVGFTAALGAIFGVACAAFAADGGHPNGGYAFMLMGLCLASVMGLLPPILWTFSGSSKSKASSYSAFIIAALTLVGCVCGHYSGGATWSGNHLNFVVGGAALGIVVLTLLAWVIVPRHEHAYSERYRRVTYR